MNSLTRMPPNDPASQWFWNGSQWVCGCDPDDSQPPVVIQPPFPPPFFPPPITQPPWYPGANGGVSFGVTAPPNPIRGAFWWDGLVLWLFDGAAWVNTATGVTQGGGGSGGGTGSGQGTVIISTQPPGNPMTGAQWWDGSVLRVWDGTKWNIVGPGASAGPVPTTTHTFRMVQQPTLALSANTWVAVPFSATPQVDPGLSWNPTTFRITPTKGGVYLWFIRAYLVAPPSTADAIGLVRNDTGTVNGNGIDWVAIAEFTSSSVSSGGGWMSAGGITLMNGSTDYVRMWAYAGDGNFYGSNLPAIEGYLLP